MRRVLLPCIGLALLVAPAGATAQPTSADKSNAAKECRSDHGGTAATREAFRVKYGTNKSGKNAFGKCVSKRSRAEESQRGAAKENAAKVCCTASSASSMLPSMCRQKESTPGTYRS